MGSWVGTPLIRSLCLSADQWASMMKTIRARTVPDVIPLYLNVYFVSPVLSTPSSPMRITPFEPLVAVTRRVFGVSWLRGKSQHPAEKPVDKNRHRRRRTHVLQAAWKQLHDDFRPIFGDRVILYRDKFDLRQSESLTFIERVAGALFLTHDSPGFSDAVLPRLLNPSEFETALHECEVASWFARGGLQVEFVPPEPLPGKRSPDLRVRFQGETIEIECKQKDLIVFEQL